MARLFTTLLKIFEKVGLPIIILKDPLRAVRGPAGREMFQMDIERNVKGISRHERFRIYPGSEKNLIQVADHDLKSRQVLLVVKEPVVEFEDETKIGTGKYNNEAVLRESLQRQGFRNVRKIGNKLVYKGKTQEGVRHFLMGFDERQLFIAQLQKAVPTIQKAKDSLGRTVSMILGGKKTKGILMRDRQGEWWLVKTSQTTRDEIEKAIRQTRAILKEKVNVGASLGRPGGNPHVADELVILPGVDKQLQRRRVFIRGKVRHIDHPTKKLNHWHEVIQNDEGATATATSAGVFYID